MTREVECFTTEVPGRPGVHRLIARDVQTGYALTAVLDGWGSEQHLRKDLTRQLEQHVRMLAWFALSCSSVGAAPVFYVGGPLDGTWEDVELAAGGKPPLQRRIVRSPRFEPVVWTTREQDLFEDLSRPPAVFEYERSQHPVAGTGDRPMAWRYLHVGAF